MSDLDRSMHISLWVQVAHSSFIEGSHMTKNTASAYVRFAPSLVHKCKTRMEVTGNVKCTSLLLYGSAPVIFNKLACTGIIIQLGLKLV